MEKGTKKTTEKTTEKASSENAGFSIIETGGKQYKVAQGDVITIEKLNGEHKVGDTITFDKVLLVEEGKETKIGTPYIPGAKVLAVFDEEGRGKKISVIKYKNKIRYRKKYGHRQPYVKVTIT